MTYYVCSLPQHGEPGEPKELFTDDLALAERFIEAEDKRPGRGVFQCINPLLPGARRRSLETVARLQFIYFDLDLQNIEAANRDDVITRLRGLPVEFIWVRDSGSGNLHVGIEIKDAPARDTPEYDRVAAVWKRLAEKLAADPAPVHPAALIRCVGTHNKKNGGNGLCHMLWNGGGPLDVTELEELDDLLAEPLLVRKPKPTGEPRVGTGEHKGPVDVEAEFAGMHDGASTNAAQTRIIPSLLRKGEHPGDVLELVVDNTLAMAARHGLPWTREVEVTCAVSRILSALNNLMLKDYDPTTGVIPSWLPGAFHEVWIAKLEAGQRPVFGFNSSGFYVRKKQDAAGGDSGTQTQDTAKPQKSPKGCRVLELRPFVPFDVAKLPPRSWLYGKHYQRCTVSLTAGPGGMGKSSLDMVEAIAMATARNLLGEQPEERLRVWYHNGEDPRDEIDRRLAAICQHYKIPQGGAARLPVDHVGDGISAACGQRLQQSGNQHRPDPANFCGNRRQPDRRCRLRSSRDAALGTRN